MLEDDWPDDARHLVRRLRTSRVVYRIALLVVVAAAVVMEWRGRQAYQQCLAETASLKAAASSASEELPEDG